MAISPEGKRTLKQKLDVLKRQRRQTLERRNALKKQTDKYKTVLTNINGMIDKVQADIDNG